MKSWSSDVQKPSIRDRAIVLSKTGDAAAFLEYIRSRIRITRATAFNLPLITASAVMFILTRCDTLGCNSETALTLVTTDLGSVFSLFAFVAYRALDVGYDVFIKQVENELTKTEKENGT